METLRLSPSGPTLGGISLLPLRQAEITSVPEAAVDITAAAIVPNAALTVSLAGPFVAGHYMSACAEVDIRNEGTTENAFVTLGLEVRIDGGAWTQVVAAIRDIPTNPATGDTEPIRRCEIHCPPTALASFGAPAATAELMELRLTAALTDGDTGTVDVVPYSQFMRLTEHGAPSTVGATDELRLSPSGPELGSASNMPLRIAEDAATRGSLLALDTTPTDVLSTLRCVLPGPFDASHYYSAECSLDMFNESTNAAAAVTLTVQVSDDDGSTWNDVWTEIHNIGANDAADLRQIRTGQIHCPPIPLSSWAPLAADSETMTIRVVASSAGLNCGLEGGNQFWLRLVEHAAP
jgi:hypothetical protein